MTATVSVFGNPIDRDLVRCRNTTMRPRGTPQDIKGRKLVPRVGTRKAPVRLAPKKISVARLPVTGSDVFGREEDLAFLDRAWANKDINLVTIVAWATLGNPRS